MGVSLIGQKWCTLLFHNLNRTKKTKKPLKPLFLCRNLCFVAKQQSQFLLLGGEAKALIGHSCVFWVQKIDCLHAKRRCFSLPVVVFTVVADWLLLIVCFGCCCFRSCSRSCCLLFLFLFNLLFLFLFLFNLLFLFLLLRLLTYHLFFFWEGVVLFFLLAVVFALLRIPPKCHFLAASEVSFPFLPQNPFLQYPSFFIIVSFVPLVLFLVIMFSFIFSCFLFVFLLSSSSSSSSVFLIFSHFLLSSSLFPLVIADSFSNNSSFWGVLDIISFFLCLLLFDVSSVLF